MTAYAFDYSSANSFNPSPARYNESRSFRTWLIFFLNLAASLSITSACWLAASIAWLFCSFFTVLYNLPLEWDTSNTVAPPPVLAAAPAKRGPMLARRPAATPQVVAKDQASVSAVHPRPTPSNYATSRVYKPATLYRGAPQRIFTANATPRAPNASFAPGSSIFTLKDMGMAQAQRSDRVVAERKEAGWERARHPEVQRRADHPTAATTSAPSPLSAIHSTAPALHIPSPLVAASSLAITNDAEDMDWDSRPLQPEPEHAQMEDVTMDDDFSSPSGEPMDHTPSLIPSLSSPVFPAMDFFNIIITRAQEDSAHIIRALRACSLSDAECAPSALPSMDAEFPALDEVAAALSACSLAERLDQTGMDANGDVAMADDDDDGMLGCSPLGMACPAPTLSLMDVDIAEDMDVGCDDFPALKTALSSLLGSGRQVSRLVKRHQRPRARVEHSPHDSTPAPKPNVTLLRLVNKYADLGIDAEGIMFRVQLDIGLGKVVKVSRMA